MTHLSPNFTLEEMTRSALAARKQIDNTPTDAARKNLERLCNELLEPIRDIFGDRPIIISSGYRCGKLNRLVGGSKNSAHSYGRAADFDVHGLKAEDVVRTLVEKDFTKNIDQTILEFGEWVHVALPPIGRKPRGQVLVAAKDGKTTKYSIWR